MPPDTIVKTAEAENQRRQQRRAERYAAQRVLWRVTKLRRLAYCGRVVTDKTAGVTVKVSGTPGTPDARAGFSGLQTCGSVWSCPVCSEKINAKRQAELEAALTNWTRAGNTVLFGTFTLRHHGGQRLTDLWAAISPAWGKVVGSSAYTGSKKELGDRERFGVAGWARLVEVKHGRHGWHPHIHALFFVRGQLDEDQVEDMRGRFFARWETALAKRGLSAVEFDENPRSPTYGQAIGVDLRRVADAEYVADYFAKNGYRPKNISSTTAAAYEVTGSQSKQAGKGGRTPFQILADLVATEDELVDHTTGELLDGFDQRRADEALWWEWEEASRGKLQLTWSRGLRDLVALTEPELSDQEAAEADDLNGEDVYLIGATDWVEASCAMARDEILRMAESGFTNQFPEWLSGRKAIAAAARRLARGQT